MRIRVTAAALSAIALLALTGCTTPAPADPTPTPAFASEEEAFAAAEETYRAYVDALNQVDLSDPETFEPVYDWTTGEANAEARKTFSQMHADNWVVEGESVAALVQPRSGGGKGHTDVELYVCLDVSEVVLTDAQGSSVVAPDRPDVQRMLVSLTAPATTDTQMAVSQIAGRDVGPACR